jgi:manganese efflux pump family protein
MNDVYLLAVGLSMDTFAVSVGLGSKHKIDQNRLAFTAAVYFGVIQALMTLVGYFSGRGLSVWITEKAPFFSCLVLTLIGCKMIYESFSIGIENEFQNITHRILLMLAVATSIDAMAAGFSLASSNINPLSAGLIIGVITCFSSYVGVIIGANRGAKLEGKAEFFGGAILILIGLKSAIL